METDKPDDVQSIEAVKFPTFASLACYCKQCGNVIPLDDARTFMSTEGARDTVAALAKILEPTPVVCPSCGHKDAYQAEKIGLFVLSEHKKTDQRQA
jgi:hypothetical protein